MFIAVGRKDLLELCVLGTIVLPFTGIYYNSYIVIFYKLLLYNSIVVVATTFATAILLLYILDIYVNLGLGSLFLFLVIFYLWVGLGTKTTWLCFREHILKKKYECKTYIFAPIFQRLFPKGLFLSNVVPHSV